MSKLLEIEGCSQCKHSDRITVRLEYHIGFYYEYYCKLKNREITTPSNKIPDWCPLPEAK